MVDDGTASARPTTERDSEREGADERFPVDLPGFSGSLEQLVVLAQRGDIDLASIPIAEVTSDFRARVEAAGEGAELRDIADFLTLAARLVALKAARLNPAEPLSEVEDEVEVDDAGRRLAEYRLFKAAAEALLAEAAEEGTRSFLGLVAPDVIPVERLRIAPERLAAVFRGVLERLAELEPLPVGAVTFSVEEKMDELRRQLAGGEVEFVELFSRVGTRLEAVACFLALLELLRRGEAQVQQSAEFGPITVRRRG